MYMIRMQDEWFLILRYSLKAAILPKNSFFDALHGIAKGFRVARTVFLLFQPQNVMV